MNWLQCILVDVNMIKMMDVPPQQPNFQITMPGWASCLIKNSLTGLLACKFPIRCEYYEFKYHVCYQESGG